MHDDGTHKHTHSIVLPPHDKSARVTYMSHPPSQHPSIQLLQPLYIPRCRCTPHHAGQPPRHDTTSRAPTAAAAADSSAVLVATTTTPSADNSRQQRAQFASARKRWVAAVASRGTARAQHPKRRSMRPSASRYVRRPPPLLHPGDCVRASNAVAASQQAVSKTVALVRRTGRLRRHPARHGQFFSASAAAPTAPTACRRWTEPTARAAALPAQAAQQRRKPPEQQHVRLCGDAASTGSNAFSSDAFQRSASPPLRVRWSRSPDRLGCPVTALLGGGRLSSD